MQKYTFEEKMKVVQAHIDGEGGYKALRAKFGLASSQLVRNWVKCYQAYGEEGLRAKKKQKKYPVQMKLDAIELYLTTNMSLRDVSVHFQIRDPAVTARWLTEYREQGIAGLSRAGGKSAKMSKDKRSKNDRTIPDPADSERIKELEQQVRLLQIENTYLKELRRLRRKEKCPQMKSSQESSTVSEDPLN